jgi:elongator complex protein 3
MTKIFYEELAKEIEKRKTITKTELEKLKLTLGKKYRIKELPSDPDILAKIKNPSKKIKKILSIKPLRTLSGVAPIAIMTKPAKCPHGTCIYCPGGIGSYFGDVPQSYTGHEPATMRGINNSYDPYLQTIDRIFQYYATGHNPEKIELIIMGGTFPSMPDDYQEEFVTGAFQAANTFSKFFFKNQKLNKKKFLEYLQLEPTPKQKKILELKEKTTLEKEHKKNENTKLRIVTMCIETKPDWCKEKHINKMLELGTTRVELGVQTIYDEILKFTNRGHTIKDTKEATQLLKDSALKVTYHIMPGQPLSTKEKDIEMFKQLYENPDFRPDGLKIYPCMVMPGTALMKIHQQGKFKPLNTEEAAEIIAEGKKFIPEYTRIHRVQRDIPTKFSIGGIDKNNLRQIIKKKCIEKGITCKCIRCREAGINESAGIKPEYSNVQLIERKYDASKGKEIFISFEDTSNNIILGFCRLRKPYKPFRPEFTENTACIRELHVFGRALEIGKKNTTGQQHKGFGKMLMQRAEEIAKQEFGCDKMLVISGIGAREYYKKKLGYEQEGVYMAKKI